MDYKTPSTLHRTNTGFEWLFSRRERPSHSPPRLCTRHVCIRNVSAVDDDNAMMPAWWTSKRGGDFAEIRFEGPLDWNMIFANFQVSLPKIFLVVKYFNQFNSQLQTAWHLLAIYESINFLISRLLFTMRL